MKWASTVTEETRLDEAIAHAAERILDELGETPDLALVFASPHYRPHHARLPQLVAEQLGGPLVFGCSAGGVIGGGREIEARPGFSLTAAVLPGVHMSPRHLLQPSLPQHYDPLETWRGVVGIEGTERHHFLLLADPFSFPTEALLQGLDRISPKGVKIGGLASGGQTPGENALFLQERVYHSGAICLALSGNLRVEAIVAQGCRPIGEPFFVTRAHGNLLLELDGRPPADVIRALYADLDAHDQALCRTSLFIGVAMRETQTHYVQGDYLIRNLVGSDPTTGALWVGANLSEKQVVQFHLRDADTAAYDLEHSLSKLDRLPESRRPAGSLLFSCLGRGQHLYGQPDHDTNAFRRHAGDVPLGGFFCNGEIGPVQGQTFVHGYTSAFGLFSTPEPRRKPADKSTSRH